MNMNDCKIVLANGAAVAWDLIPQLDGVEFAAFVKDAVNNRFLRCMAFFAVPEEKGHRLTAIFGNASNGSFEVTSMQVTDGKYTALTPDVPALHMFEREIWEQSGIIPEGHPQLKPVRFENTGIDASRPQAAGVGSFFEMDGQAVHEVAVGPIHAGVIEPGHFRFQCMGEKVYSLEISLGYQHRGIEKMLRGKISPKTVHLAETASGDTSVAAASAYALAVEGNTGRHPDKAAAVLRAVAIELERIANHVGDLGALAGDVAFLPTASFCGRIRGEYLNMTAAVCGNRFGRGIVRPEGSGCLFAAGCAGHILKELNRVYPELRHALDMLFASPTVLDRFENTGTVSCEDAAALGGVGPAARASGMKIDARIDFPASGVDYGDSIPGGAFPEKAAGDVISRARVRYQEIINSHEWLFKTLAGMEEIPVCKRNQLPVLCGNMLSIGVTEAWRGEYTCVILSGENGDIRHAKITDPSFHNWSMLAHALRNEEISHFPVCNKSFNLSYCGHDL